MSAYDRVANAAESQVTKMRWWLGLNGLFAVVVGVMILVWPSISLYALTLLFGAYALVSGIVSFFDAFTSEMKSERGWLIVTGLLGIAVGIMVLAWPSISALALLYVIGVYAVALGVITIAGAFWLPVNGGDTALMILSGLVSIVFGIVIFARPGAGALVTLALIAAFMLVTGVSQLVVAIGGKRLVEHDVSKLVPSKQPQPQH
jgi:uncharacterized membrane protein HdeD (DUF308 family)